MDVRNTIILLTCIFLFSCTHKTVSNVTYGEKQYIQSDYSEAELAIILEYEIPEVVKDKDKFYFKTYRPKTVEYSDGTFEGRRIGSARKAAGKYRDGKGWCNSSSYAKADKEGIDIKLNIAWGRQKSSGNIDKNINVNWDELPKTIRDESNNLTIKIERKELKNKD